RNGGVAEQVLIELFHFLHFVSSAHHQNLIAHNLDGLVEGGTRVFKLLQSLRRFYASRGWRWGRWWRGRHRYLWCCRRCRQFWMQPPWEWPGRTPFNNRREDHGAGDSADDQEAEKREHNPETSARLARRRNSVARHLRRAIQSCGIS